MLRDSIDTGVFFDLSPELNCVADASGRLVCVNDAWETVLGRSARECEGLMLWDPFHPDDAEAVVAAVKAVSSGGPAAVFRNRACLGDGSSRWFEWRAASPDGVHVYAVAHDISQHVAIEQLLRASQSRLRESQRVARVGHYSFDIGNNVWSASSTLKDIFGIDESYVCDLAGWLGIVHADDRDEMQRYVAEEVIGAGKPFDREYRIARIGDGAERWCHGMGNLNLDAAGKPTILFGIIQDITPRKQAELSVLETNARLERMVHGVAEAMGRVVEARDPYTQGHELGVARLGRAIALEMGLSEQDIEAIEMASLVHDIGKLAVPAEILTKPGRLSGAEFALIKEHSQTGFEILKDIDFPWPVAEIVLQHHERMDGSGYPRGLLGDEILVTARVVALADVVEAMASHRPYRPSLGLEAAIAEISKRSHLYDRDVARACNALFTSGRIEL